jgi:hypothetical protein
MVTGIPANPPSQAFLDIFSDAFLDFLPEQPVFISSRCDTA